MNQLEIKQVINAPQKIVWDHISDHEGMVRWSAIKLVVLDKEGTPERNGVGAVRRMMGAGPTVVEEVTGWEPPNHYTYTLTKGAPIRDHQGKVELVQEGDATSVHWTIQFRPIIPGTGWLLAQVVSKTLGGMLKNLQAQVETKP